MRNLAIVLVTLLAASANATVRCAGATTRYRTVASGERFSLAFNPVAGATRYVVTRSSAWVPNPVEIWDVFGEVLANDIWSAPADLTVIDELYGTEPEVSFSVYYIVLATNTHDATYVQCAQDFLVTVAPDPSLSRDAIRSVIPVAGSLAGLNGSRYETRLTLRNDWNSQVGGRIMFHPTGRPGAADDPSIRYQLEPDEVRSWDDVVHAMGANGLGSIDIIPDEQAFIFRPLPDVRAQVVSVAANGGAYGTDVPVISMRSAYRGVVWNGIDPTIRVDDDGGRKRLSLGIRTLSEPTTVAFILQAPDKTTRATYAAILPPDYHEQRPIAAWFNAAPRPGDRIQVSVSRRRSGQLPGGAIVYLAETDNVTNDIALRIPRQYENNLRGPIVQCGIGDCQFLKP